jgi:hypothetical protein
MFDCRPELAKNKDEDILQGSEHVQWAALGVFDHTLY